MTDDRSDRWRPSRRAILVVIVIAIALLAARALDFDVLGWLRRVVDDVRSVPLRYVIAVFVLKAVESLLAASAWRAILQATYPEQPITFRFVLGAFAGGLSINVVTPAMAATAVMLGLYRLYIRGATMPTILATAVVENITFGLLAALTWIILIASTPSAADTISGAWDDVAAFFSDHPRVLLVTVVAIVVLLLVALYKSRRRLAEFWQQIVRGGAILRTPSRYLTHVVLPQVLSYVCRLGQTMVLMAAFGIPVTVHTVFLVIGTNTAAKAVRVAPGGIGTTETLMVVAMHDYADPTTVTAFSLAKTSIISVWNITFGIGALLAAFGVEGVRNIVRRRDDIVSEVEANTE